MLIEHHGDIPGIERVLSGYQGFSSSNLPGGPGEAGIVLVKERTAGGFVKQMARLSRKNEGISLPHL